VISGHAPLITETPLIKTGSEEEKVGGGVEEEEAESDEVAAIS